MMSIRVGLVVVGIVLITTLMSGHGVLKAEVPAPDTMLAVSTFGGESTLYSPRTVRLDTKGNVYIMDTGNHRIVVFDANGEVTRQIGVIGSGPGEFYGPTDLALDSDGRIYVSDSGNRRIQILTNDGGFVQEIPVSHPVQHLLLDSDGSILLKEDIINGSVNLMKRIALDGTTLQVIGDIIRDEENRFHVNDALNRIRMASCTSNFLMVAMQTVPQVRTYAQDGKLVRAFEIHVPEIDEWRKWFYKSRATEMEGAGREYSLNPTYTDFIEDIKAVCVDGKPHGSIYLNDIHCRDGLIYLLVYGTVYVCSHNGDLLRRLVPRGPDGGEIYCHRIWVAPGGSIYGIDTAHEHMCYKFSPQGKMLNGPLN